MSSNLEVALRLSLHGQQLVSTGLAKSKRGLENMAQAAHGATAEFKRLYDSVNGFSTVSKGIAALGGTALLRDTENTVLAFQRMQLELKQTAGLTNAQVAQISDYAKSSAAAMLSTPTAMIDGALKLANAGEKWENLLPILKQAASDAAAFRATVGEMANMDFDISSKMKIDSSELSLANNMMLYHARSGRFEAPAMSRGAPELFTYAEKVGLSGTRGLNLVGAMTQQVMKGVAPDQQGKVLTNFEQGLSHIVTPHYMKGLSKVGIDVQKYMPNGKFYGEGGVEGFTDLVKAMKAKGLEDPFKMAGAGFADKETKDFWYQMMKGVDGFSPAMREAAAAAKSGQTEKDRLEIAGSAVGQDQQAKAKWEARQLDAAPGVGIWESLKNQAAENPLTSAASLAVLAGGARSVWKKRQAGKAAAADTAESARQTAMALRQQNVFVTNWPGSMQSAGELLRQKREGRSLPDVGTPGGKPGALGKAAQIGEKMVTLGSNMLSLAAAWNVGYEVGDALYKNKIQGTDLEDRIGGTLATIAAWFGNKEAQQALEINLHMDGQQITQVVNAKNSRDSRRN